MHDAGPEDGRDAWCCGASGTSNLADSDLDFYRIERAYPATVNGTEASSDRSVVPDGQGPGQGLLVLAARLHAYSTRDVVGPEEHRVGAHDHEPGALRHVADGH